MLEESLELQNYQQVLSSMLTHLVRSDLFDKTIGYRFLQAIILLYNVLNLIALIDLLPKQMVNKNFLGHICTAMMLNELEVIVWCYTLYCLMTIEDIRQFETVKFANQDELVLAASIFAKVSISKIHKLVRYQQHSRRARRKDD